MSVFTSLGLLSLVATPAAAFWRLPCKGAIVNERADPIVNPGKVSGHLHQIMGGNAFDFQMDYNTTQTSTCTSCTVHGDFSNYWTPVLYYQHQNGSFEKVNQVGGALVYYLQRKGSDSEQLKAFPEGFRMLAGDPFKRAGGDDFASQAISYNCLDYSQGNPETPAFPTKNCPNGLRSQLFFPSCWDGQNLDSADHKSHMSYPIGAYNGGSCPDTHPVHLVSIFYEIIWDTNAFKDMWYGNQQPFVWSMGDPTGYGFHGDFINGWDVSLLQKAVDTCTSDSGRVEDCPVFQLYPDSTAEGCKIASQINEPIQGPMDALPGCNPVTQGPNHASPVTNCNATSTLSAGQSFFKDLTSSGWAYQGCGTDNYYSRALTGASTSADSMTNEACTQFCASKGFSIAGSEYARECYCANDIPTAAAPLAGVVGDCSMPCAGNNTEMCGGSGRLSLYKKCDSGSCTNVQTGVPKGSSSGSGSVASALSSPPASLPSSASNKSSNAIISGSYGVQSVSMPSVSAPNSVLPTTSLASHTISLSNANSASSSPTRAARPSSSPSLNLTLPNGWSYTSCQSDNLNPRSLGKLAPYTLNNVLVTSAACVAYCDSKGFTVAGTEYGGECYCDNSLTSSSQLDESKCAMPCKGDSSQTCGGPSALSVFTKSASKMMHKRDGHMLEHIKRQNHGRRFTRGTAGTV